MASTPAPFVTNSSNKTSTTPDINIVLNQTTTLTPVIHSAPIYAKATEIPKIRHMKGAPLQPILSLK